MRKQRILGNCSVIGSLSLFWNDINFDYVPIWTNGFFGKITIGMRQISLLPDDFSTIRLVDRDVTLLRLRKSHER